MIDDLYYLRFGLCSLTDLEAANMARVHLKTYQRWERINDAPEAVWLALMYRAGFLYDWSGWQTDDDLLISNESQIFALGEIRALPFRYQQIAELQKQVRILRSEKEPTSNIIDISEYSY